MFHLKGKVALITGATGGIPRATAALFRRLGGRTGPFELGAVARCAVARAASGRRPLLVSS